MFFFCFYNVAYIIYLFFVALYNTFWIKLKEPLHLWIKSKHLWIESKSNYTLGLNKKSYVNLIFKRFDKLKHFSGIIKIWKRLKRMKKI